MHHRRADTGASTPPTATDTLLNVGCGRHVHPAWINIDVVACAPGVRAHDVRRGLPFQANSCQAVYHSHLLEHLSPPEAAPLLSECFRVLRPGGAIRVVVPDLERMAEMYLEAARAARTGLPAARERHAFLLMELVDQLARHAPGGEFPGFLRSASDVQRRFAIERWGHEAARLMADESAGDRGRTSVRELLRPGEWLGALASRLSERWRVGTFRTSGEAHRWMYDAVSLAEALGRAGFVEIRSVSAVESRIAGWATFGLDADGQGTPHKPDSLYMEASKPEGPP